MRGKTIETDGLKFRNLPACSTVPQPTTLPRIPNAAAVATTTTTTNNNN
jgi:hypothetical protein